MSKILFLFFTVLMTAGTASALNVFACEGTSAVMNPGSKLHMKLLLDEKSKEFTMYSNGLKSDDKVTLLTPKLAELEEYIKCDPYDEPCKEEKKGKDPGFAEAAAVYQMSKTLKDEMPKGTHSTLAKMKAKDLAKARIYTVGETTKFGGMGVYEYFDKDDKLLGRYIYAIETLNCKNKEAPTNDLSKLSRKSNTTPANSNGTESRSGKR
ncbi:MAG: hypothetical protein EOP04_16445 [Proteobacteria bacterium]|nr:MAG: hypothetical protein EOP04_16445 [Pseudomonadota bacterium]